MGWIQLSLAVVPAVLVAEVGVVERGFAMEVVVGLVGGLPYIVASLGGAVLVAIVAVLKVMVVEWGVVVELESRVMELLL